MSLYFILICHCSYDSMSPFLSTMYQLMPYMRRHSRRAPAAPAFAHSVPDTPSLALLMASETPLRHPGMMYDKTTISPYKT